MKRPAQIIFKNVPRYESIEERVQARIEKLDKFCDRIMSCRVVIDVPHQHHVQGNPYSIKIELTVPGKEIVVAVEPSEQSGYDEIDTAIGGAFDSARRQLEDYMRRRHGHAKTHFRNPTGTVTSLDSDQQYGYITAPNGEMIYFHANSVKGSDFEKLTLGSKVSFLQEPGDDGPQARIVKLKEQPLAEVTLPSGT